MRDYISEFIDLKAVEFGSSLNTLSAYKRDMKQFVKLAKIKNLISVKKEDIEFYLDILYKEGNTPKTISRKLSCIREFFKFLQSENIILDNPASKIRSPKIGKGIPEFLTIDEISLLCKTASEDERLSVKRIGVIIRLMSTCGLRVSEVISLKINSINYELKHILVCGKGNKERLIPITKEAIKEVLEYSKYRNNFATRKDNKWLFPSLKSLSGHITRDAFFKQLKALAIMSGISPSRVYPHVLRHSFATHLVNNEVDLRSIQKMLGHESITTTEIYTHITSQKLANEVRQKHPLMKKYK